MVTDLVIWTYLKPAAFTKPVDRTNLVIWTYLKPAAFTKTLTRTSRATDCKGNEVTWELRVRNTGGAGLVQIINKMPSTGVLRRQFRVEQHGVTGFTPLSWGNISDLVSMNGDSEIVYFITDYSDPKGPDITVTNTAEVNGTILTGTVNLLERCNCHLIDIPEGPVTGTHTFERCVLFTGGLETLSTTDGCVNVTLNTAPNRDPYVYERTFN
jgi:hypothetical protein